MKGAIIGPMAEVLWGIPEEIEREAMGYLPDEMINVVERFYKTFRV
jgi:hypothetical protein